jgi:class 3 adenylate cyclase
MLPGAASGIALPPLLESFLWVDMREFSSTNVRPLANLVAGILGQRPRAMEPSRLAEQVAAILSAPRGKLDLPEDGQEIVLPVNLPKLDSMELEAVRQQTARLLGIPSDRLKFKGTRPGSVKVVLVVEDLNAVSQLFAMVSRSDSALQEFFQRCQIDREQFSRENVATAQRVTTAIQARQAEHEDPDAQVSLASVPEAELKKWKGGAKVLTVAVVFTGIVDSTRLCNDLTDVVWDGIRQQHFKRAVTLIRERAGILIKNTGDGILALFHDATAALSFAVTLHDDTGHATVRIRAGVHVGQVGIDESDAFGRHMNFAARVMGHAKADGVMVSNRVREDVVHRGEAWVGNLRWKEFPDVTLKGFPEPETLWGVESAS